MEFFNTADALCCECITQGDATKTEVSEDVPSESNNSILEQKSEAHQAYQEVKLGALL